VERERPETELEGAGRYQRASSPLWFVVGAIVILIWALAYVLMNWGGLGPGVGY
jgi:hypothetical protein